MYKYISSVPFYKNRTIGGRELVKTLTQLKQNGTLIPGSPNEKIYSGFKDKN